MASQKEFIEIINRLKKEIERIKKLKTEPIAIIGIGCRFPDEINGAYDYWKLIADGRNCIKGKPELALTIADEFFDADFFNITPSDAENLSLAHRILIEVFWEAIEYSGISADTYKNNQTAVFIGADASNRQSGLSERISHTFGFTAPSLNIDAQSSSSLAALDSAVRSLRMRQCSFAFVGSVSLMNSISQDTSIGAGEGAGVVILKRLSEVVSDGDNVLAVILGSSVNYSGRASEFALPDTKALEELIIESFRDLDITPLDVDYIEACRLGLNIEDTVELNALTSVYCKGRSIDSPLMIGSVEQNVGFLGAASGIAALIKVALAIINKTIPKHINRQTLNPNIVWENSAIKINYEKNVPFRIDNKPSNFSISSVGKTGSNAHIIIQTPPNKQTRTGKTEPLLNVLPLSAKTADALYELVGRYGEFLSVNSDTVKDKITDLCYTAQTGRTHFNKRIALIGVSAEDIKHCLADYLRGAVNDRLILSKDSAFFNNAIANKGIVFVFTGLTPVFASSARQLYDTQPVFRDTLNRCDEIYRSLNGESNSSLISVLYETYADGSIIEDDKYIKPLLFSIEYALFELWRSWGITPACVIGHGFSIGEYGAAAACGIVSIEDALKLITVATKTALSCNKTWRGVYVYHDLETVNDLIAKCENKPVIMEINSPHNIVICGSAAAAGEIIETAKKEGKNARLIPQPFYEIKADRKKPLSSDEESSITSSIEFKPPAIPFYSSITGKRADNKDVGSPNYWRNRIFKPVRFKDAVEALYADGFSVYIEIGLAPYLVGFIKECLPSAKTLCLCSLNKGQDDLKQILSALSALYVNGKDINWQAVNKECLREKTFIPAYPFQRKKIKKKEKKEETALLINSEALDLNYKQPSPLESLVTGISDRVNEIGKYNVSKHGPINAELERLLSNQLEAVMFQLETLKSYLYGSKIESAAKPLMEQTKDSLPRYDSVAQSNTLLKQMPISGSVPMSSYQRWFFSTIKGGFSNYSYAVMLNASEPIFADALDAAIKSVIKHHDLLGAVFTQKDGAVIQEIRSEDKRVFRLAIVDLRDRLDWETAIDAHIGKLLAQFDLSADFLIKAALFRLNDGDRIFIAIHSLIADNKSLCIILEDLISGYTQIISGRKITLSQKTDSFMSWTRKCEEASYSDLIVQELALWTQIENTQVMAIPKDFDVNDSLLKGAARAFTVLSQENTKTLLETTLPEYDASIEELLITALCRALTKRSGYARSRILINAQCRELPLQKSIDVTRTVGSFSFYYPVIIDIAQSKDTAFYVESVKKTLRAIPNKGIGYGLLKYINQNVDIQSKSKPEVMFNHNGDFDTLVNSELLTVSSYLNRTRSADSLMTLEVNTAIVNSMLEICVSYDVSQYKEQTIEALLTECKRFLLESV
ncbi:polyketide synthase family protein [Candidatus Magnetoovum chiemensis]|nr:polyketide synthase family protein [Candidatus Magnetoovum chiemensis]